MTLVQDNLAVLSSVDDRSHHLTVLHEGATGNELGQAQVRMLSVLRLEVLDVDCAFKVVQVRVRQLNVKVEADFVPVKSGKLLLDVLDG